MGRILDLAPFPCKVAFGWFKDDQKLGLTESAGPAIAVKLNSDADYDTLESTAVHEAVHVAQAIEEHVETKFDDETEAYVVQYVFEWIKKQLKKKPD